jgi:hypothetical protein
MSFLKPALLITGPDKPYDIESFIFMPPMLTNLLFHMLLLVNTTKISVKDLKQSLENKATSRKNSWFNPVQSTSLGL